MIKFTEYVINFHRKEKRLSWRDDDEEKAELEEKYVGDETAMKEYLNDKELLSIKEAVE